MSINIKNLSFSYGTHKVLDDISFEIEDGCLVTLLGPNGVGKSTLFKCILGLLKIGSGTIEINGKNIKDMSTRERAQNVAYIPQAHLPVFDYKVRDVVLMSTASQLSSLASPGKAQIERADEALETVGLLELRDRTYTQISGGEQQLVLIARALAQNAKTIIMDEPTSALDYGNTARVLTAVKDLTERGLCIFQSTHNPDHAFYYSDKTLALNAGKIVAFGDPKEVITRELIRDLYSIDANVVSLFEDKIRVCIPDYFS